LLERESELGLSYSTVTGPKMEKHWKRALATTMQTREWAHAQMDRFQRPSLPATNTSSMQASWIVTRLDRRHWFLLVDRFQNKPVLDADGNPVGVVTLGQAGDKGSVVVGIHWNRQVPRWEGYTQVRLVLTLSHTKGETWPFFDAAHFMAYRATGTDLCNRIEPRLATLS
jgi:hypothetical protein